ncbi:unnamed protein product [Acanthoscelides obtectus]|uniref:Uncharacterized protein n=1 Tax=Acanthoscelides obtectus TaxID=200917 RepID=A0A9P0PZ91_ACAOB|nr:unnamed protein product [Acanthoscelides obtectus]CAK1650160.1 hypothetical protein AOBTE_LOCUS16650 [Acanthoscelides obtectus]
MRLKLKIDIYNLILGSQQALPQMTNAACHAEPSTSSSYSHDAIGQQYSMPHSEYQLNSYSNTPYDTRSYTSNHQTYPSNVQIQTVTPVPTPSPSASTIVSENSQESSELDLLTNTDTYRLN